MKKMVSILILCVVSLSLIGCSEKYKMEGNISSESQIEKQESNDIVKIVYNQLNKEMKEEINIVNGKTKINKIVLEEDMGDIFDESFIGKEVYIVEFTIKDEKVVPNNRIVYVTPDEYKVIGYGLVD